MTQDEVDVSLLEGGLEANRGGDVIACSVLFILLCTLLLVMRFVASHIGRRPIFLEDWLMVPAWVLVMGMCADAIWSVEAGGVGRHQAWVLKNQPKAMISWAQSLFVIEFMYGIAIPLEKTTILLLYLRIFKIHRWFRILTYGMIVYIWMWGVSESIVAVVQCRPVEYQWNKSIDGSCIDQLAYYRWVSVPNALHDVAMVVAPIPMLWKLQIALKKKIALMGVLVIGSIGCVASFIRMYNFFILNALSDRTWASIQLMSWTVAEPGVILICASMPSIWPLLRRMPGLRSSSKYSGERSASGNINISSRGTKGSTIWAAHSHNGEFIPLHDLEGANSSNVGQDGRSESDHPQNQQHQRLYRHHPPHGISSAKGVSIGSHR